MSTIIAPEDTFLDNGSYDKFLEEVTISFESFIQELDDTNFRLHKLSNGLRRLFKENNYRTILVILEKQQVSFKGIHSYVSTVKDIKRLALGTEIRRDYFQGIKEQIEEIFDASLDNKDKRVTEMIAWLKKHPRLQDWKMMLSGHEKIIFATQERLSTHLSNEEVRRLYKGIIDQIRNAQTKANKISQI